MCDVMGARMLNGKTSTSSCTYKLSALHSEFWLLFHVLAKGIKFDDVPVGYEKMKLRFRCEQPFNVRDANSIRLKYPSTSRGRLQLT